MAPDRRPGGWPSQAVRVLVAAMAIAACGSTAPETAPTSTTRAATATAAFCGVYPAFAEKLNMALANANPDVRQYTVIEPILTDLAPVLQQLRDAEPPALKGTAETWVAEMHKYATGNYPVTAAEEARSRMADWASSNC